ncbi:MAG: TRZ/ATZ family hydrolase [Gammaproteobacteria bacterium]|nr:TRZ/ATZ family hydrolase [Gammaproteobacteria bacterium]
MQAELLICARWVAPVEPVEVLEHYSVAIADGRVAAVLPTSEAEQVIEARETVHLDHHILIPGLVNAHTHAAMTLLRGYADDLALEPWLKERIWPAEARLLCEEAVRDGALAGAAEMLAGGVTTFADMYFYPQATIHSALALGMRVAAGIIVVDFPSRYAANAEEYLQRGLALHDEYRSEPLASFLLAPHAPYTVSDDTLARIASYAAETNLPIQTHLHETASEIEHSLAQYGKRPLARLEALDLAGPALSAVHMTQVDDQDLELLGRYAINVVHCPESNLKLASGFCPVAKLLEAGVNVALGTDGAASNNDLDLLGEMQTAALLAKGVAGDPGAFDAATALRAATLGGARAIGRDHETGSIEPGKWADLTAVCLDATRLLPLYDPLSQLVYAGERRDVSGVWVAGERRVQDGAIKDFDAGELRSRLQVWQRCVQEMEDTDAHD